MATLRIGPQRYSVTTAPWPFVTTQSTKFSVTIYASDNNIALENNVLQINPQLSSAGENEFVTPLTVAIIDTNGTRLPFGFYDQNFNYFPRLSFSIVAQ